MSVISRSGISVLVPPGWEAEMFDYSDRIVLHLSDAPLFPGRSDFGGRALRRLRSNAIFIAVLEYDSSDSKRGLFGRVGRPAFVPSDFAPNRLHHQVSGQSAAQKFFTVGGRTFCCYAVIARETPSIDEVARVNQAVRGLSVNVTR